MAEIIELKGPKRPRTAAGRRQHRQWPAFSIRAVAMPLAEKLVLPSATFRDPALSQNVLLESGVFAFRRGPNGVPLVLLISKKRSTKWGIPKGRVPSHLGLAESAAKEAYEEAGVIGYVSTSSVGMFRAKKAAANLPGDRIIEVWVYLLEVTDTLPEWPEKGKRETRWVSCETAARHLREPVLMHLCHRLAQIY